MNISTTSTSTSDVTSTQSRSNSSSKTSEKSFNEEMNSQEVKESKATENNNEEKKVEQKDSTEETNKFTQELKTPDDIVPTETFNGGINFTDYKYNNLSQSLLSKNIQNLLNTKDLMNTVNSATTFDYDVINMTDEDANFFADLVQNTDMSMKSIATQLSDNLLNNTEATQKSMRVSSVLMEKLAESVKNNQPFRIDFDKDISVIIKVNKDGSIMANFIPGDKAVEQYLRNNIASLRQRFDEENLSYSELSYSNSKQQQQRRKKENDNE